MIPEPVQPRSRSSATPACSSWLSDMPPAARKEESGGSYTLVATGLIPETNGRRSSSRASDSDASTLTALRKRERVLTRPGPRIDSISPT
ncbi:MAG: hypothetical protein AO395_00220 [Candidatus Fermentibacter daniensis]|nr:MAG: hypothetical protein AO395_00220 [Candidatus Fermentibacter daniensis]